RGFSGRESCRCQRVALPAGKLPAAALRIGSGQTVYQASEKSLGLKTAQFTKLHRVYRNCFAASLFRQRLAIIRAHLVFALNAPGCESGWFRPSTGQQKRRTLLYAADYWCGSCNCKRPWWLCAAWREPCRALATD